MGMRISHKTSALPNSREYPKLNLKKNGQRTVCNGSFFLKRLGIAWGGKGGAGQLLGRL